MKYDIHYGKAEVTVYRTYATPLRGLTPIPESDFTERDNHIFAARVDVQVLGSGFLAAYTEGDNRTGRVDVYAVYADEDDERWLRRRYGSNVDLRSMLRPVG